MNGKSRTAGLDRGGGGGADSALGDFQPEQVL